MYAHRGPGGCDVGGPLHPIRILTLRWPDAAAEPPHGGRYLRPTRRAAS